MKKAKLIFFSFLVFSNVCFSLSAVCAQTDGTPDFTKQPRKTPKPVVTPKKTPRGNTTQRQPDQNRQTPRPNVPSQPKTESYCAESIVTVNCGLPDCLITVDGKSEGVTNVNGTLEIAMAGGKTKKFSASKNGYEPSAPKSVNLPCGETVTVAVALKPKPFTWRIKTNLPESEIYINDPPQFLGKSDADGVFQGRAETSMIFVQAKKPGYLTESITITPENAQKEIAVRLRPMPSRLTITTNITGATAQIKGDEKIYDTSESFPVEPGNKQITVSALGFSPVVFEMEFKPNQRVEKNIKLNLLPIAELMSAAESSFNKESFQETIQLCRYILQTEPDNPRANRLLGMVYLGKLDYAQAESFLIKAVDGDEKVTFKVRRHFNEKFELGSGHGTACEGELLITKSELEYRGFSVTSENFKVPLGQVQIVGIELKKNTALYLSLKITEGKSGKKDYNFYSRVNELTQTDKAFLQLIQKIILHRKSAV